ncbi:hypothetical protein GCM10010399_85900 [Dactylosporangium fulvum]|uniref:STAS domain-containing protein n=1 Tax=Dactylosporangium fulvum TaxID=53359 RepID=A0ABY5WAC3_9ACTN|nr:STAS domain-containing protein [Dactylosporangium fulvum]UWP87010.1 STAS domain-containing protein [Dactylosporangium fulvum]
MTALLSRDGTNFSLACDGCGQLVTGLAPTMGTWNVAWSLFVEDGWRGADLPTGPHACGRCADSNSRRSMVEQSFERETRMPAGRGSQRLSVSEVAGVVLIEFKGDLHLAAIARLYDVLMTNVRPMQHVLFDVTSVPSIDSGTLAVLVRAQARAARHGARVCLVGASQRVLDALRMLSVEHLLPNFAERAEALGWLRAATPTTVAG